MHPVCGMLQEALRGLVDRKYGGNIRKAAKYLEIDYNLAYRIFHGQQKNIAFFDALRLVKSLSISADGSVLREYYPKEFSDASEINGDQSIIDEIFEAIDWALSRPLHYEVLIYCSEMPNVNEQTIAIEYGSRGALAFKDLLARKLVTINEKGFVASLMSNSHWAPHSICLKNAAANLSLLRLDRPGSYIRNRSVALNQDGLTEYYKAHSSFAEMVKAIEKDEKYSGSELIVSGLFMGPVLNSEREGGV